MQLEPIIKKFLQAYTDQELADTAAIIIRTESYTAFTKQALQPLKEKMRGDAVIIVTDPETKVELLNDNAMRLAGWVRIGSEAGNGSSRSRRGRSSRLPEESTGEPSAEVPAGTSAE